MMALPDWKYLEAEYFGMSRVQSLHAICPVTIDNARINTWTIPRALGNSDKKYGTFLSVPGCNNISYRTPCVS